jgi:prevent-host-death family protein
MNTWNATDAKRNFSQLLRTAEVHPQLVVRRGKPLGVIIGYQQYVRMEARQSSDSVAGWLDQLKEIRDQEADPRTPDRSDRSDQFGEDWE